MGFVDLDSRRGKEALDRHITGNYGEDQFKGEKDEEPKRPGYRDFMRRADGRIEWLCEHGVGHPVFAQRVQGEAGYIHGCDGCCNKKSPIYGEALEWFYKNAKSFGINGKINLMRGKK